MQAHASIAAQRGSVVVCVDDSDRSGQLDRCLDSVVAHTPEHVPIVVCGSGAAPAKVRASFPDVHTGLNAVAPADVVILRSDSSVCEGWLEGLRDAAYVDSRAATATALSDRPPSVSFEEAASALRRASPRLRPRIPAAGEDCVYVRRDALELVGDFSDLKRFSTGCLHRGLCHVLADDVLVEPPRAMTTSGPRLNGAIAVTSARAAARRALQGLSIAIDARVLTGPMNGTKLHVLELTAALARAGHAAVQAIVTADLDRPTRSTLEAIPGIDVTDASRASGDFDLVHRPFQVESPGDLAFLASLGGRVVITQQDLIGYYNPGYFPSPGAWRNYRALTRRAMVVADRVLFFSEHVRAEALSEDLVEPGRASVVHIGVDHHVLGRPDPAAPQMLREMDSQVELMVCLGTDYAHKNRPFALRILAELRRRHEWHGRLVLAGSHVPWGGSRSEEERMLEASPELADAVLDLGPVSEAEKAWLLQRASLVVYPTVSEGFGLIPFEAANYEVPCLWAKGSSLSEVLPDSAAAIVPWDAAMSADRTLELMRDPRARAENLEAIKATARDLTWSAAAQQLLDLYRQTTVDPPAPAGVLERQEGLMRPGMSEDAMRLLGPEGALPRELERPLLALATHPRLRRPVFGAIKAGYRLSHRWRRVGRE